MSIIVVGGVSGFGQAAENQSEVVVDDASSNNASPKGFRIAPYVSRTIYPLEADAVAAAKQIAGQIVNLGLTVTSTDRVAALGGYKALVKFMVVKGLSGVRTVANVRSKISEPARSDMPVVDPGLTPPEPDSVSPGIPPEMIVQERGSGDGKKTLLIAGGLLIGGMLLGKLLAR